MSCTRALAHAEPSEELERLNASLGMNPNQAALLLERAEIQLRYQHFDEALDESLAGIERGMIELGPLIVLLHVAFDINLRQGDRVAALNRIEKKIQSIDRKESWLLQKAEILLDMGQYENAQEQLVLGKSTIDSFPHRIRNSAAMIELHRSIKKLMKPKIQFTGTKQ